MLNINEEIRTFVNNGKERGLTDEEIISEANEISEIVGSIVACEINMRNNHPNGVHFEDSYGKWKAAE